MASFFMKKLIASNLVPRSIIPFRSALATNRREYTCLKDLINHHGGVKKFVDDSRSISERIPYTASWFVTDKALELLNMGAFINLAKYLKVHICTPGVEKWKETDEGLCTLIDMGLGNLNDNNTNIVSNMERNVLSIEANGKDTRFFSRVYLPVADDIRSEYKIDRKEGGVLITLPKQPVASDYIIRSVFPSVETTQLGSIFNYFGISDLNERLSSRELLEITMKVCLDSVPHTLYTYETHEGLEHLKTGDFDIGNVKQSIHVPGNETRVQTDEGLCIYLDLGMGNWGDYKDVNMKVDMKEVRIGEYVYPHVLFIEACAKNKQSKITCSSCIYLNADDVYNVRTKIKNGVLIITFSNVKED